VVLDNREKHKITVINMSLGDEGNYTKDTTFGMDSIQDKIKQLRNARVAVVVSAGNDYFTRGSKQGMSYPAIFRETVSVGAPSTTQTSGFQLPQRAKANTTGPGRITPSRSGSKAPMPTHALTSSPQGALTSAGNENDHGESIQHGTSQAAPWPPVSSCCCRSITSASPRSADHRGDRKVAASGRRRDQGRGR
jgi:hypothetical protein